MSFRSLNRVLTAPKMHQCGKTLSSAFSTVTNSADAVLSGANAQYVDATFRQWSKDPTSVHSSWATFFATGAYTAPPSLVAGATSPVPGSVIGASAPVSSASSGSADVKTIKVLDLIRAYQANGHAVAKLDPLERMAPRNGPHPELTLAYHGLGEADLDTTFHVGLYPELSGFLSPSAGAQTLRQILARLEEVYAGPIGFELQHVTSQEELQWLRAQIETATAPTFDKEDKTRVLNRLAWATQFESFLKTKYNVKRFGLEGGEATIVALRELVKVSAERGVTNVVMGMPHRGRLNVLANVVKKPLEVIFSEFAGATDAGPAQPRHDGSFAPVAEESPVAADVKYHNGWSSKVTLDNGKSISMTMMANPSHLEAVNPLVQGKTRSKQARAQDDGAQVMSLLLHGDASFAGQGVVFESMAMCNLPGYSVGGTVHVVVNNQIGFTTDPYCSRSGPYCTDLAKAFGAPIFHVNADEPEAVARVGALAAEYRAKFKKDVVLDVICYRVNGHNELDQPSFTQPMMYKAIAAHPPVFKKYAAKLVAEGTLTDAEVKALTDKVEHALRDKFETSRALHDAKPNDGQFLTEQWAGIAGFAQPPVAAGATGVALPVLQKLGGEIAHVPEGFELHRGIKNAYVDKAKSIEAGAGMDWATAEALAFASLLDEGVAVRIAGQDAERGTFSHRHAVVHDQKTGDKYTPLLNITATGAGAAAPAKFTVVNSLLSEFAALGFEYGYSLDNPQQLVIWEAQFGDFVNGAQIIIDNFMTAAEAKWNRQSGLVMLLPHGYEGQGAEHSSARMERFLQAANDDETYFPPTDAAEALVHHRNNIQVANMTSAANYFHALRNQIKTARRKPLVVFSPKSLLRFKGAAASFAELEEGTAFRPVIGDATAAADAAAVKRHVLCSGKVYFDLVDALEKAGPEVRKAVAVTRVEMIAPFPMRAVAAEDAKYPNATETVWAQEEHMNMGPWVYAGPRAETAVRQNRGKDHRVRYIGRAPAAAAATGSGKVHTQELEAFLNEVVTL
jgi:2-oxoglutarate dehydrogenase E1 component